MSVAAVDQRAITEALLAAEAEAAGYEDPEVPFISPHSSYCHNSLSSSEVNRCAICTNRRQRTRLIWAVLLVWSVPLALATARCCGWWGPGPRTTNEEPDGRLIMVQVLFRHGARTPLSNLYWPNTTWKHCKHKPLAAAASGSSSGIQLQLYDPSGAPKPPELSGDDEPLLPGGCRMGHLTDTGFQMALDLGSELRRRYINQHRLLPSRQLDTNLLHAESTAVQRTVTTLRGVLTGLYPNASADVRVAVRPYSQELMTADWEGCPALANLTTLLTSLQAARDAEDPAMRELQRQVRSGLQLPPDVDILWNRLRDELACLDAEGQPPPAAALQEHLVKRVDYVTTQHRVEVSAPEAGYCLFGRGQEQQCREVTALTSGRLLHTFISNMATAAAHNNRTRAADDSADSDDSSTAAGKAASSARRLLLARSTAAVAAAAAADGSSDGADASVPEHQPQPPKLMLFSAHDTTLLPLLSALGQHQKAWPGFASHLAFELWGHKGKYFVRVLHDGEPLRLPLSPAEPQGDRSSSSSSSTSKLAAQAPRIGALQGFGPAVGAWRRCVEALQGVLGRLLHAADKWPDELAALLSGVTGKGTAVVSAGRLQSNGQGVYNTAAYVVTLDEFQQRVVQDYVMGQEEYAAACGSSAGGAVGGVAKTADEARARRQWHAQFY